MEDELKVEQIKKITTIRLDALIGLENSV